MNDFDDDERKKAIEERSKKRRDRELGDLRKILRDVEGRRFIWRLLSESGIFRSSFHQNALSMAHNEGGRNLGLLFLNEIMQTQPAAFNQMQREHASDLKSEKEQRENEAQ